VAILTLIRAFTERQAQVADAIGRDLTYAEIAGALTRLTGRTVAPDTIRTHVRTMALLIDGAPNMEPRQRIYLWVKQQEWEAARLLTGTG
jgi:DNA-binding CsgD family transcriptional regulator